MNQPLRGILGILVTLFPSALLLASAGSVDPNFASGTGADGAITKLERQADGRILIAGAFTTYDGVQRPSLARLETDGRLDTSVVPAEPTPRSGSYGRCRAGRPSWLPGTTIRCAG